jgi:hypothetical protein
MKRRMLLAAQRVGVGCQIGVLTWSKRKALGTRCYNAPRSCAVRGRAQDVVQDPAEKHGGLFAPL